MNIYLKSIKQSFLAYLPAVIWASVIFILSHQSVLPSFEISAMDFIFKKSAHMFVYAVLYYLFLRASISTWPKNKKVTIWIWLWPLIFTLIYAIVDELHQSTVPGRHATARDVAYDMLGAITVLFKKLNYI